MKKWTSLSSEYALKNKWIKVRKETCDLGNGKIAENFFTIERTDYGIVAAFDENKKLVMIRQYRHSIGKFSIEFPAGHFEKDEEPVTGTKRELREETGYSMDKFHALGTLYPATGIMRERAHFFWGEGAKKVGPQQFDEHEDIEVILITLPEAIKALKEGKIFDMATALLLFKLENETHLHR